MSLALPRAIEPTERVKEHRVEAFSGIQLIQYNGDFAKWRVFKDKFEAGAQLTGVLDYLKKPKKEISDWSEEKEMVARRAIITSFADKVFETISESMVTTPVDELYAALCVSCVINTSQRIKELKRDLWAHVANEGDDIKVHFAFVDGRVAELRSAEHHVTNAEHIDFLLDGLPAVTAWSAFQNAYRARVTETTRVDQVRQDIRQQAAVLANDAQKQASAQALLSQSSGGRGGWKRNAGGQANKSTGRGSGPRCYRCEEFGHIRADCPKMLVDKPVEGGSEKKFVACIAPETRVNETATALHAYGSTSAEQQISWAVDSGASHHVVSSIDLVQPGSLRSGRGPRNVSFGNDTSEVSEGLCTAIIPTIDGPLEMPDCMFVPGLSFNLLSVGVLAGMGYQLLFDENKWRLMSKHDGRTVAEGPKREGLFWLDTPDSSRLLHAKATDVELWHRRLGHPGIVSMLRLEDMVTGPDIGKLTPNTADCTGCQKGKQPRLAFPKKSESRETKLLGLVHSDLAGPFVPSWSGKRYYVTFVDDASRYTHVYFIKQKSEAFERFKDFQHEVERQTGQKLKILRSDNGGEYVSNENDRYLREMGIVHQRTVAETPQQNGVAERMNRTIKDHASAMLHEAGLKDKFWSYAVHTAVHLCNRLPTRAHESMTPYEAWKGIKPDVSYLRVFGCRAWVHTQQSKLKTFVSKASEMIFVGYPDQVKGYRFWDPESKKERVSRDATFVEDQFGRKGIQEQVEQMETDDDEVRVAPFLGSVTHESEVEAEIDGNAEGGEDGDGRGDDQNEDASNTGDGEDGDGRGDHQSDGSFGISTNLDDNLSGLSLAEGDLRLSDGEEVEDLQQLQFGGDANGSSVDDVNLLESLDIDDDNLALSPVLGAVEDGPHDHFSDDDINLLLARARDLAQDDAQTDVSASALMIAALTDAHPHPVGKDPKDIVTPKNRRQMLKSDERDLWIEAEQREIANLLERGTWELVDTEPGQPVIGNMWRYKLKLNPDGSIDKFKARLVAHGDQQEEHVDFSETFAPVAKFTTIRTLLVIAVNKGLKVWHMDVVGAYLNGYLSEKVFMHEPIGYESGNGAVCRLKRTLYGLRQSGREWYIVMSEFLLSYGFLRCEHEQGLFVLRGGDIRLVLYVDDLLMIAENDSALADFKQALSTKWDMTDLGIATQFCGMELSYASDGSITLSQARYCREILKRFGLESCNGTHTPMMSGLSLSQATCDPTPAEREEMATMPYMAVIGSLMYLMTATRPDLAHSMGVLSRFMAKPSYEHWRAAKQLLRYVQHTKDVGLVFKKGDLDVHVYSDSDYAGDLDNSKSTSGYIVMLGPNCVSWSSRKQEVIAQSTTEAEYIGLANATKELEWVKIIVQHLLHDFKATDARLTFHIHGDNQGAIALANDARFHTRTKHIRTKYHFVRDCVRRARMSLGYVATGDMIADLTTKALGRQKLQKFMAMLGLRRKTS